MLESSGVSDVGSVRANNEDYYLLLQNRGLYVVADGMGGAQAGEHASRLAAETVADIMRSHDRSDAASLVESFNEANRRVMSESQRNSTLEGMGTTLVAALESGNEILIASVGDSRAYLFNNATLTAVTDDQTWCNEVGRRLGIDEATLKQHPMRHVLTMAIGVSKELRVHSYAVKPSPGMQLLLCTDGLHGVIPAEQIASILAQDATLDAKCQNLVQAAKAAGAPDNVTAILLKVV